MSRTVCRVALSILAAAALSGVAPAQAQTLGTFRWRTAPFCNVLNLSVSQQGDVYVLSGFDDRCGASARASVTGMAYPNLDGTIGIGLTTIRPDGLTYHDAVVVSSSTLSGTWTDPEAGDSGAFLFNPVYVSGLPRPVTFRGNYSMEITYANVHQIGVEAITFPQMLPAAPSVNFLAQGATPTINCPGTPASPAAAPNQLCVYESLALNVDFRCITDTGSGWTCGKAERSGASVLVQTLSAGVRMVSVGSWAVSTQ